MQSNISYNRFTLFSKLVHGYIDNDERLLDFHQGLFSEFSMLQRIAEREEQYAHREVLVDVLLDNYEQSNDPSAVKQIKLLQEDNTFTITTGHQLNMFSGPLYTIYKVLHCIKLAKHCKSILPQFNFVPVFWLHTEDHDVNEINHFNSFGKRFEWNVEHPQIAGRIKYQTPEYFDTFKEQIERFDFGKELISIIEKSYVNGKTLAECTFDFYTELFHNQGLVILNPDQKELKQLFLPTTKKQLEESEQIVDLLQENEKILESLGYHAQAKFRDVNLFWMDGKDRIPIHKKKDDFVIGVNTYSKNELTALFNNRAEQISPNVITRPLYQEEILPNLVTIGGGGEIAYWLQLKTLFTHCKVPYPILMLRQSMLQIEPSIGLKMNKIGLEVEDVIGASQDRVIREQLSSDMTIDIMALEGELRAVYDKIKSYSDDHNLGLSASIEGEKTKTTKGLRNVEKKIVRELKRVDDTKVKSIETIYNAVLPNGKLQERVNNFSMYFAKYGPNWLTQIEEAIDPLNQNFRIINFKSK